MLEDVRLLICVQDCRPDVREGRSTPKMRLSSCNRSVVHIEEVADIQCEDLLDKLANMERASEHPLAVVVLTVAQELKRRLAKVIDFGSPVGQGVSGKVDCGFLVSGKAKFLAKSGIDVETLLDAAET